MKKFIVKEAQYIRETVLIVEFNASYEANRKALRDLMAAELHRETRKEVDAVYDRRSGNFGKLHFEWTSDHTLEFYNLLPPDVDYILEEATE